MDFNDLEIQNIRNTVGSLCERKTNPALRDKLRFDYVIENQSVIIQEIRPYWRDESQKIYHDVAKLTYVKTKSAWSLFWKRASGKWQTYEPAKTKTKLVDLVNEIEVDKHNCFFG